MSKILLKQILVQDKDGVSTRFPCRGQRTKSNAGTPVVCVSATIFTFSLNMRKIREAKRKRIEVDNNEQNVVNAVVLLAYRKKIL